MKKIAVLLLCVTLFLSSCGKTSGSGSNAGDDTLTVHYIDVGQGDSAFIEFPGSDGCMLIDAGESEYGETVSEYISSLGYTAVTVAVATHPHSDHIGGFAKVFKNFDVGEIYMPKVENKSRAYENLINGAESRGTEIVYAKAGIDIADCGDADAEFVAPIGTEYKNLNNYSAVLRIDYSDSGFLFSGDAEKLSEDEITADISCDVVKVGHHGSATSSGNGFIQRTGADIAVISVGIDNKYGHPDGSVLRRWTDCGASIYRTDVDGTVVITSDGKDIKVKNSGKIYSAQTESRAASTGAPSKGWVLNINSKKIHTPDCGSVENMLAENRLNSTESLASLLEKGYDCCGSCKPSK